jgi:hypothetical protein
LIALHKKDGRSGGYDAAAVVENEKQTSYVSSAR